ncbi:MAG: methylmalonyl Co-A mutase-associated GTPase MeaB [Nitrospiria bacterium]
MQRGSFNKTAFVDKILKGDLRSASKLLTLVEQRSPAAIPHLKQLYPHTGKAHLIGVTGPAGAGKSTLMSGLVSAFRQKRRRIGVLAIDPTSPFSGGAILGDRLRMRPHFLDREVFIRSLAVRGAWGGISPALFDAIHVLDAMGKEIIFVETVGVGQDEVQIARLAETVLLVLSPGFGDAVQIMKAGLLEIGDITAVNKGDLKGAGRLVQLLRETDPSRSIVKVSATKGEGLSSLVALLEKERIGKGPHQKKKVDFVKEELQGLLRERFFERGNSAPFAAGEIEAVFLRKRNPYALVHSWIKKRRARSRQTPKTVS